MLQINVNLLNNLNVIFISLPTPNELFPLQPPAVVMNMHNKFLIKINFSQTWDYSSAIINVKTSKTFMATSNRLCSSPDAIKAGRAVPDLNGF